MTILNIFLKLIKNNEGVENLEIQISKLIVVSAVERGLKIR